MRTFKNPTNGHTESVDVGASLGVFFLGFLYLLAKGLWVHVLVWIVVVIIPAIASGGPLLVLMLPLASLAYAVTIQDILAKRYLHDGWIETSIPMGSTP